MGALVWVMMGLALWHFAIFLPDRFWSGIIGAFLGALIGSLACGLAINGFTVPGPNDTDLVTALEWSPARSPAWPSCTSSTCGTAAADGRFVESSRLSSRALRPSSTWS